MAIDATALVGGALGGAVAQSILTPWFAQRHERRDLRAGVVRSLSAVERTRWAPKSKEKFRQALTDLRTAALVAGVNRALIDQYILFACAGRHLSDISFERNPDPEFGGGIDSTFAGLIEDGAAAVMDFTWHPWLRRTTKGMVLARLNRRKTAVTKELEKEGTPISWEAVWVPS
jgi:hypothetical protein